MKTSEKARKFIKEKEGLKLIAYKCTGGVWTIGYGHTGAEVVQNLSITLDKAESYFNQDIAIHENNVSRLVTVPLTQYQFDALVSFEYNLGYGNLKNSTLLRLLNAKDYAGAAAQFGRWVYSGGRVTPGLVTRREQERKMFLNIP